MPTDTETLESKVPTANAELAKLGKAYMVASESLRCFINGVECVGFAEDDRVEIAKEGNDEE